MSNISESYTLKQILWQINNNTIKEEAKIFFILNSIGKESVKQHLINMIYDNKSVGDVIEALNSNHILKEFLGDKLVKGIVERVVNTNPEYIPEILTSDLLSKDTVKYCIDKTIEVSPIHILNIYQENSNCSQLIDTEKFYNSVNEFMYVDSKYALYIWNNENKEGFICG